MRKVEAMLKDKVTDARIKELIPWDFKLPVYESTGGVDVYLNIQQNTQMKRDFMCELVMRDRSGKEMKAVLSRDELIDHLRIEVTWDSVKEQMADGRIEVQ